MNGEQLLKRAAIVGTTFLAVEAGVFYAASTPSADRPNIPGVYEKKPEPTPNPEPKLIYGVDPLEGMCANDPSATVEDDGIVLQDGVENKIVIGGVPFAYNIAHESLIVAPGIPGNNGFVSTIVTIDNSSAKHKDPDARQYSIMLGESIDLAPPGVIPLQDFLSYPKASRLKIVGSCLNKVTGVVKQIFNKTNS